MASDKPRFTPANFAVDKQEAFASLQLRIVADKARATAVWAVSSLAAQTAADNLPTSLALPRLFLCPRWVACVCGSM